MCSRLHSLLCIGILILAILGLSGCAMATAGVPSTEAPEVVATVVVEKEVATSVEPVQEPQQTEAPTPSPAPTSLPTPAATAVPAAIEARIVELEWPPHMRLGDSDILRISLIPSDQGYSLTTEFPDHQVDIKDVEISRPPGLELYGAARIDAVGFSISPQSEQELFLPAGEMVTWQWALQPTSPGQHRLSVMLLLRWRPEGDPATTVREVQVFRRGLQIEVSSFFGLTRRQAMTGGMLGLFFGCSLSLVSAASFLPKHRSTLLAQVPNPNLAIEHPPGITLSPIEISLLSSLFRVYSRLLLKSEFLSGYSGARTFLATPVHADGRADAHTIVKLGARDAIEQEFTNYERFIKDTLPPVTARIQHRPVTIRGRPRTGIDRAALRYTFIGLPEQMPVSLRLSLQALPDPSLLLKLFDTFGSNWWMQRKPYAFRLYQEYDRVLPTHLVLEPVQGRGRVLDGRAAFDPNAYQRGDLISLINFPLIEKRMDGRSLSLAGSSMAGSPAPRVRWMGLGQPNGANGRVIATRWTLLQQSVQDMDRFGLPDPLPILPKILQESLMGTQSIIHGDLNLENILVGPGGFVWLIDFAMTREGHTLFDFAHLSAELIAHVISMMVTPEAYIESLPLVFTVASNPEALASPLNLLTTMLQIARRCLFDPTQPREFYLALYLSCLGALKFINLNSSQKQYLYLTAAYLSTLI
jgi:hypothetical protein